MKAKKLIPIFALVFLVVTIIASWWLLKQQDQAFIDQQAQSSATKALSAFKPGPANECQRSPAFISKLGLTTPLAIDTEQRSVIGISIVEAKPNGQRYQHPSWDDIGHVGSTVRDKHGNLYVLPIPVVSLEHNKLAKRNTIYKIDSQTQIMSAFIDLGLSSEPMRHPFGVLALSMDCATNSLYVSSVDGTLPNSEKGITYQIDLVSKKIISRLVDKDIFGHAVLNTSSGKRLYYGSARTPNIFSVSLGQQGQIGSDHRYELSLAELPQGDTTTPVKIRFSRKNASIEMTVQIAVFNFRPSAANEAGRNKYLFNLDASQQWVYQGRR